MMTETRTLYAVRATFSDPAGSATHEYLYGDEPTVFTRKELADERAAALQHDATGCDWGTVAPPVYHVETISEADLWDAETIAEAE